MERGSIKVKGYNGSSGTESDHGDRLSPLMYADKVNRFHNNRDGACRYTNCLMYECFVKSIPGATSEGQRV